MVVSQTELVFNDTPSKHNRDLTNYLKRHMENIIRKGNIKFLFKIAKTSDLQSLRERGIKRLPVLLPKGRKPVVGVPDIIHYLQTLVKSSKKIAAPKSDDEVLNNYMMQHINDGVTKDTEGKFVTPNDENVEAASGSKLLEAYNSEMDRRGDGKKKADRSNPPPVDRSAIRDDDTHEYPLRRQQNIEAAGDPMNFLSGDGNNVDDDMLDKLISRMNESSDMR